MSDNDLAKALLELDASSLAGEDDTRVRTSRILARDQRRLWWLTALAIVLWCTAVLCLYWCVYSVIGLYLELENGKEPTVKQLAESVYGFLVILGASLEAIIFAVLVTVILLIASRRATLRQINANLVELSNQLAAGRTREEKSE